MVVHGPLGDEQPHRPMRDLAGPVPGTGRTSRGPARVEVRSRAAPSPPVTSKQARPPLGAAAPGASRRPVDAGDVVGVMWSRAQRSGSAGSSAGPFPLRLNGPVTGAHVLSARP
jgi:hypothetical protein